MKNIFLSAKEALLTIIMIMGTGLASMAATFTASTNGNWSSPATWGGGAPTFIITGADKVIIPAGITVTLDNNLIINNADASLTVRGFLTGTTGLTVTNGTLSGAGTVTLNALTIGEGGFITSVGSITVNQLSNSQATLAVGADINISTILVLSAGLVQLNAGGTINLADKATINMAGGTFRILRGFLDFSGGYNLLYTGSVATMGQETLLAPLQNLTIDLISASSQLNLTADQVITGILTLQQGMLNLSGNKLTISPTGSIIGGSTASYLITDNTSSLTMAMGNEGVTAIYPVGTAAGYTPLSITNNSATGGSLSVTAHSGVFANGLTGADLSLTQSVVNTSWDISSTTVTGANVDIEMFWTSAMQVNGFGTSKDYISQYTAGQWNTNPLANATANNDGTFSQTLSGVTTFSPVAVFDRNSTTSVQSINTDMSLQIYPNPAADLIQITVRRSDKLQTMKIFDAIGNQMVSQPVENDVTSLDISRFPSGVYFVQFDDTNTKRFIKQ